MQFVKTVKLKLFVNNRGHILGPIDVDRILALAQNGRLPPDVTVSDDRVNWIPIDEVRKLLMQNNSPATPQARSTPNAPQADGYPGMPQAGGYPGAPQAGGYPGMPQAGDYPGMPKAAGYPGMPQTGGYPENATVNGGSGNGTSHAVLGSVLGVILTVVLLGGGGWTLWFLFSERNQYDRISNHIDLWMRAVQQGENVSGYATDLDVPITPVSWKIVTEKSAFKGGKESYYVRLLVEQSNKMGLPIRTYWRLTLRKDENRKTGYVITYANPD